jgi:hypothetical protein
MSTPLQSAARQAAASPALTRVLAHFPEVTYAFAYGSGAHHQPGLYATEPLHSPSSASSDESAARAESAAAARRAPKSLAPAPAGGKGQGKGPVLDFIFAVEDAHKWHEEVKAAASGFRCRQKSLGCVRVCHACGTNGVDALAPAAPVKPSSPPPYVLYRTSSATRSTIPGSDAWARKR